MKYILTYQKRHENLAFPKCQRKIALCPTLKSLLKYNSKSLLKYNKFKKLTKI